MEIGFKSFDTNSSLHICFGKPYANDKSDTAKASVTIYEKEIKYTASEKTVIQKHSLPENNKFSVICSNSVLEINGIKFEINENDFIGYTELNCENGIFPLSLFEISSAHTPYTSEEHELHAGKWRHTVLDEADEQLLRLEKYISSNPGTLPQKIGDIVVSDRLVDKNTEMNIRIISYGSDNAAITVTHNSLGSSPVTETIPLNLKKDGNIYYDDIKINFSIPGNTKLELWLDKERIMRQIAVLDNGYMAVIPWVGHNKPFLDEALHKFDIAGDYWMPNPELEESPEKQINKFYDFIKNYYKYGDRTAAFVNAKTIVKNSEVGSLFDLDRETLERGFKQLYRQMKLLGYEDIELIASYTPDSVVMEILEKLGVKGLTSLCAWQNCADGGWKINHCGVSNQPYYPADDDFRRSGDKRSVMCFTMANSSCNRNYSLMALDGCPTNIVPGERYFSNRVVHHQIQRFYDAFDGYIADPKQNNELMTVTVALEGFCGWSDWTAANELAIRYMVKKAETEKLVFTSAADVSLYHQKKNLPMQNAYFFQPDYYYGYHNGELPGAIPDRIEADTNNYLAVIKRGSLRPMYFYDYTAAWENEGFEDIERNEFGLVNPDTHDPSECVPAQVDTRDIEFSSELFGNILKITAKCGTDKKRMVTGIFDIPFENDFLCSVNKPDASVKKITDRRSGNTHLFVDMGALLKGENELVITIDGIPRTPEKTEFAKDGLGAMWFIDHVYLRSIDKDAAISVTMDADDSWYVLLQNGVRITPENGRLTFTVNADWSNEAPLLFVSDKEKFVSSLENAKVEIIGPTTCSRWSW